MNEDLLAVVIGVVSVLVIIFSAIGLIHSTVIKSCQERGYWQTGQTRIICSVEGEKK